MDFVTPISDILNRLCTCVAKNVNTIRGLKAKVIALYRALYQLQNIKDDVAMRVQLSEERWMERTKQVDDWLKRVESLENEAKDVSDKAQQELQRNCWSCFPNRSRYKLADEVNKKLKIINDLKDEGKFDVVADLKPRGPAEERPLDDSIGLNMALEKLRRNPSEITGVDDDVFRILRFSYDNLRNDVIKSCFIYCSIYREDSEIRIDHLLDLWIGEGFLDEFDDIHEARDRGLEIIEDLVAANMLEKSELGSYVKMHVVIRAMALWISRGCEGKINKYMVLDRVELLEGQSTISRMTAEKISLWGGGRNYSSIPNDQSWLNVSTLIMRNTEVKMLHSILSMPNIKVLELSQNIYMETLPSDIGGLVELEFLAISRTRIRELPIDIAKLTKLKYLLLSNVLVIPPKLISNFCLLRVFRLMGFDSGLNNDIGKLLEELESLQHLSEVSIELRDAPSVNKLRHSSKLQNCMRELRLHQLDDLELPSSFVKGSRNLEILSIVCVEQLIINWEPDHGAYFNCLRDVSITLCQNLVQLTCLIACAPALELLYVYECRSMIQIVEAVPDHVGVEPHSSIFSRLKVLQLWLLPSLLNICPAPLPFPSLVEISVRKCPNLRRLPFDSSSAKGTLKKIVGEREFWDQLQWDDQTYEPLFRPYFVT